MDVKLAGVNSVLKALNQTQNMLVEYLTMHSDNVKIKLKAKVLVCLFVFSIFNYLAALIFRYPVNGEKTLAFIIVVLLELKILNYQFSGAIFFSTLWFMHTLDNQGQDGVLRSSIWLGICPMFSSILTTPNRKYIMLFFWGSIIINYFKPLQNDCSCQVIHGKVYFAIVGASIISTIMLELSITDIEKDAVRLRQKNEELYRVNQELNLMKEQAIGFSEQLRVTVMKLEESNKSLEQAVNAKRNFITKVSDELRNPLNSIMGNVELLEEETKGKPMYEKLISIKGSADLLLQLANNIIDASKLQLGTIEINRRKTYVRKMCERLWALNFQKMKQKMIRGHLFLSKSIPKHLLLDEEKVLEICHNLLTNSVKYTDKGNIKIFITWHPRSTLMSKKNFQETFYSLRPFCETVQTTVNQAESFTLLDISDNNSDKGNKISTSSSERRPEEGLSPNCLEDIDTSPISKANLIPSKHYGVKKDSLVLSTEQPAFGSENEDLNMTPLNVKQQGELKIEIIDSGTGMDISLFPSLYKSIFQTDSKLTEQLGGKGLGLYVSTELAKLMKGDICYFTKKGLGTSIIVRIPSETPAQFESSKSFMKNLSVLTTAQKKVALVVDDDKMNREIITMYLGKMNIYALHAENGQEAIEIFKSKPDGFFCFATMDLQMPNMNGIEACKRIREIELLENRKKKLKNRSYNGKLH